MASGAETAGVQTGGIAGDAEFSGEPGGGGGNRAPPPTVSYAAAALVYERLSASSTKRFTAADQKNPTCPPG